MSEAMRAALVEGRKQVVIRRERPLSRCGPLSPFSLAIAQDPLRHEALWGEWALLAAVTAALPVGDALCLERRELRE